MATLSEDLQLQNGSLESVTENECPDKELETGTYDPIISGEEGEFNHKPSPTNDNEINHDESEITLTMGDLLNDGLNQSSFGESGLYSDPIDRQNKSELNQNSDTAEFINTIFTADEQDQPRWRVLAFAAKRFASAIQRNPDDYDAHYNWALILQETADRVDPNSSSPSKDDLLGEACKRYQEATRLSPTLNDAYYNWAIAISDRARIRGRTKEGEEMWIQATQHYERAVQLNWNNPQALNNWGLALQELSSIVPAKKKVYIISTAISKFRAAIQQQFDFHRAIYNLGTVLYGLAEDTLRVGVQDTAKEALANDLYSQCAIYIAAAHSLRPNNSVYSSALRLVRSMLPLPYMKVGYLSAPPIGNPTSPHREWKQAKFVLNHEGLYQIIANEKTDGSQTNDIVNVTNQCVKVEIPDIVQVSASTDLSLPPGAGLCIHTTNGPVYLVAGSWESLDGWLDALRLVYTIYAKGRTDVLAGILAG